MSHLSLHDCLSLGEIELGLQQKQKHHQSGDDVGKNQESSSKNNSHRSLQEIHRLPLFLRVLSLTRPLACTSSLPTAAAAAAKPGVEKEDKEENGNKEEDDKTHHREQDEDALVNQVVERLEHVAATYSVAEGVDVVASHLAPTMCRKISTLSPLKAPKGNYETWDTKDLAAVARNPRSMAGKRRRKSHSFSKSDESKGGEQDDTIHQSSSEEEEEDPMETDQDDEATASSNKRRKLSLDGKRRDSEAFLADQDSTESTFLKTLSELASLVVASLAPIEKNDNDNNEAADDQHPQDQNESKGGEIALTIDDSILSEATRVGVDAAGDNIGGGAIEGSDLGSTGTYLVCTHKKYQHDLFCCLHHCFLLLDLKKKPVASIMFNAPVLQSRHVAHALCRAAIPQAGDLVTRLGANCPASVPSLLLGCIDAYSLALEHGGTNTSIIKAAKQGVKALAKLSSSEKARVQNKLQYLSIMVDVQLQLSMETLPSSSSSSSPGACCLLIKHLSDELIVSTIQTSNKEENYKNGASKLQNLEQSAGNTSSDFRQSNGRAPNGLSKESSMIRALGMGNLDLYKQALDFFAKEFSTVANDSEQNDAIFGNGKICLLLKAYTWLLLVPIDDNSENSVPLLYKGELLQKYVEKVSTQLIRLTNCLSKSSQQQQRSIPKSSNLDRSFKLIQAAMTLTMARMLSISPSSQLENFFQQPVKNTAFHMKQVSMSARDFCCKFDEAISSGNTLIVMMLIVSESLGLQRVSLVNECFSSVENGVKLLGKTFSTICDSDPSDNGHDRSLDLISNASILLVEMSHSCADNDNGLSSRVHEAMSTILKLEPTEVSPSHLIQSNSISEFVVNATVYLSGRGKLQLPFIMAPQLELLGTKQRLFHNVTGKSGQVLLDDSTSIFLLLLLHAFEYLEQNPKSPFSFDPRTLPIKEALERSKIILEVCPSNKFLHEKLKYYIERHCPEIATQMDDPESQLPHDNQVIPALDSFTRQEIISLLNSSIRSGVEKSKVESDDQDATTIERVFLEAKSKLSDADLCCTVVSSLLASPHKPPPTFTYSLLCRDPLVLLKCPYKVWKCSGLRRITLTILCSLLESNAVIVTNDSQVQESTEEFLAARDAVVIRCLLTTMTGSETGAAPIPYCSMTTSVVRSIIRKRQGVVALLVKQGLSEKALDWLVEFVPETMNDSQDMIQMLSDRRSLTPAERLVAAASILRIAIVQGHSNEIDAAAMAYSALSQLIDAFFLVLGPVGVPVNALLVDDFGLDVTQISRKAAFRILRSLLKVRGRRSRLRKECAMALHKIASLCKGESAVAGVAGAVAGRRKNLLKEIFGKYQKEINYFCLLGKCNVLTVSPLYAVPRCCFKGSECHGVPNWIAECTSLSFVQHCN